MSDDHDRMGRMVGDARKRAQEAHDDACERLGEEADRATKGGYCCEICRRKERE